MKLNLNSQAEAFGCFLQTVCAESLPDAIYVPYFNCRERGFVVAAGFNSGKRWAFFEHRNSDELCCVAWLDDNLPKDFYECRDIPESAYKTKWDVTKSFGYGEFGKASGWLVAQFLAEAATKQAA
jgi:hypothetical protein